MRIERMNPTLGTDIRTFPFFVKLHMAMSLASSIFFRVPFTVSWLLENVSRISWRFFASAWAKFGTSKESCAIAAERLPGAGGMWGARWPGEQAFARGFH